MSSPTPPVAKTSLWTKIMTFIKKLNPLHWIIVALAVVLIIGGIYGFIQIKNLFVDNSSLVKQLGDLRTINIGISADATKLAGQLKQSQQLIDGLNSNNKRLASSLSASEADRKRLEDAIANSTGFTDTISSNNTAASGLIQSVIESIGRAISEAGGPTS